MVLFELPAIFITMSSIAIYKSCKYIYKTTSVKYTNYKQKKKYKDISPICEYNTFDQIQCVICFEDLQNTFRQLPCKHIFHKHCIDKWILHQKGNCPICNYVVL